MLALLTLNLFVSAHFLIGSFIFLELSCISCLYIFEISCLSVASFAVIFSHSEGCLFTLLIVSFAVQKLLILITLNMYTLITLAITGRIGNIQALLYRCLYFIWLPKAHNGKKNPPVNAGDTKYAGSIPGLGRSPGVGNGNPLQYSCLENFMDRGA